jgi:hypothetical protein
MAGKWKVLGFIATVFGAGLSILAGVVEDKKMEATIEEKVDEALAKRDQEESEES